MARPPDFKAFLRAVHLGLGIMLFIASLPFFAAAAYGWLTADQFAGFAGYEAQMLATARDALWKGAGMAGGAIWMLVLWRQQYRQASAGVSTETLIAQAVAGKPRKQKR